MSKSQKLNLNNIPILQSFLVKSNLSINLDNLVNNLPISIFAPDKIQNKIMFRSGTIVALKYNKIIKGQYNLFKTKTGFKNACHIIICHTLDKRKKKLVHVKITAVGTFQVVGIPDVDVEKVVYKIFLILEKLNKTIDIFKYTLTSNSDTCDEKLPYRFEIVIVPILNNYMMTLNPTLTEKIFLNSKVQIVQKFIDNKFLSFMVPNDPAITIKKSFVYGEFKDNLIKYIIWTKKQGKTAYSIPYESYITLLNNAQKDNAMAKKYLTFRLYSSGKILISGFDKVLMQKGVENFLKTCDQF